MSALADVKAGVIYASIEIAAAPEAVFDAFTDPSQLANWWGSPETYRSTNWQIDLRVGGAWSSEPIDVSGRKDRVYGRYLEIERPRLLVYTWQPSWENFAETVIRIELTATPQGTHVKVTHSGFGERAPSAAGHARGWVQVLGWLAGYAALR